ncbi:hypothetical protein NE683_09545 [Bariatricus massiliensis]|nr:hypothetical protein [Bariatricus massiliensis]MDY2662440.1 hypothetical protein [Bariatricus massiliensis]
MEDSESGMNPQKAKYLLPIIINNLIKEGTVYVKMLETRNRWIGFTNVVDKASVADSFKKLVSDGVYKRPLF